MTSNASTGWSEGAVSKVSRLVSARLVTQAIGFAWFLLLARLFDRSEMGILAAGLVTFALVAVVGDAGTSWSLAREVTAEPSRAWAFYRDAIRLRLLATGVIGVAALTMSSFFVDSNMLAAMALGVAVAVASGMTESAVSTLRGLGIVRFESIALPAERLGFVAIAALLVGLGGGPLTVMGVYVLTNTVTAVAAALTLGRSHRVATIDDYSRLWGPETRGSGLAFAVLALGPRVNLLIVVLLLSGVEVADYSVASRPIEQLSLAAIGFSSSMLPLFRDDVINNRDLSSRAGFLAAGFVTTSLGAVVWVALSSEAVIDLMYGAGRYPTSPNLLAILAPVAITWPLRGLASMTMVASSRAVALARVSAAGLLVNVAFAWPLTAWVGVEGAAATLVLSDLVTVVVLVAASGMRVPAARCALLLVGGGLAFVVGAAASLLPVVFAAGVVAVMSVAMVGAWVLSSRSAPVAPQMSVS